jgi:hypothetical protein
MHRKAIDGIRASSEPSGWGSVGQAASCRGDLLSRWSHDARLTLWPTCGRPPNMGTPPAGRACARAHHENVLSRAHSFSTSLERSRWLAATAPEPFLGEFGPVHRRPALRNHGEEGAWGST